jgi:hypothetical protein
MLSWARDQPEPNVRSSTVAVVALTLCGTLACSAADPLAPPTAASSLAAQRLPLDISGGWVTSAFTVFDWLPGAVPNMDTFENLVRCESYAIEENEEWNSLILKREGLRITGTSRPEMGIQCYVITPEGGFIGWFVDIDASFDGLLAGTEVRLALNKYINARVKPDLINGGWAGTIRVRMDPRPYAAPYWIEQPFTLRTTSIFPCWLVHLDPPYCIEVL